MALAIKSIINALGSEPKYRIKQALAAVYQQAAENWDEATVLPKALRDRLNLETPLGLEAKSVESDDQATIKAAFDFDKQPIESVLMRHHDRNTVCVSVQAGCAMACDFCLTGTLGFSRNLTSDEIIDQVLYFSRWLKPREERVTNVVFMGMGEPFMNYDAVIEAARRLNDSDLFNIGARHISISTVGVIPGIKRFAKEPMQMNLSVSLHAPDDDLRSRLMPVNRTYPMPALLSAVQGYIETTRRRVMIEYVLLKGINDSPAHAGRLADLLRQGLDGLFVVNLIKYNPTGRFQPSDADTTAVFKRILVKERINVVERYRFGGDIKAACGQLAGITKQD